MFLLKKLQRSIKDIIDKSTDDMTIKGVRRLLEKKHGIDLTFHKRKIKAMVKEVLNDHN